MQVLGGGFFRTAPVVVDEPSQRHPHAWCAPWLDNVSLSTRADFALRIAARVNTARVDAGAAVQRAAVVDYSLY